MKKIEWMVAAGTVATIAGAVYAGGCADTRSDCMLLGTCGEGGGTGSAASTAASSTGTGAMIGSLVCESRHYGDAADQAARSIHVDKDANLLLAGDFDGELTLGGQSATVASKEVFVTKLDASWKAPWLQHFAVSYGAVAHDPSGSIVLAGSYAGAPVFGGCPALAGPDDLYVVKLKSTGECAWAKSFTAPGAHVSIAVNDKGKIAVAGDSAGVVDFHTGANGLLPLAGNKGGGHDCFLAQLDADGNVVRAAAYGGNDDDVVNDVAFDIKGGIIITGTYKSDALGFDDGHNALPHNGMLDQAFVARFDDTVVSWAVGFPGKGEQRSTALAVAKDVAFVAGDFNGTMDTPPSADPLTIKGRAFFLLGLDISSGNVLRRQAFDGAGPKTIRDMATDGADTVALTGSLDGDVDFGLVKLNAKGGIVVARLDTKNVTALSSVVFGSDAPERAGNGILIDGASLFITGSFNGNLDLGEKEPMKSGGGADVFVAKCQP